MGVDFKWLAGALTQMVERPLVLVLSLVLVLPHSCCFAVTGGASDPRFMSCQEGALPHCSTPRVKSPPPPRGSEGLIPASSAPAPDGTVA